MIRWASGFGCSSEKKSRVASRKSCAYRAGPPGPWLRCSSSAYLESDTPSSSRLARDHDYLAGYTHDFRDATLPNEMNTDGLRAIAGRQPSEINSRRGFAATVDFAVPTRGTRISWGEDTLRNR